MIARSVIASQGARVYRAFFFPFTELVSVHGDESKKRKTPANRKGCLNDMIIGALINLK